MLCSRAWMAAGRMGCMGKQKIKADMGVGEERLDESMAVQAIHVGICMHGKRWSRVTTPGVLQVGFCCKVVVMRTGMQETALSKPCSVVGVGFWGAARRRIVLWASGV